MEAAPAGTVGDQGITPAELRLAARNHAIPVEAIRDEITPPGLHYVLIHFDIPAVDAEAFALEITGGAERGSRSCCTRPGRVRTRRSFSSPASTEASKEASRRPTSAPCRSPRPSMR